MFLVTPIKSWRSGQDKQVLHLFGRNNISFKCPAAASAGVDNMTGTNISQNIGNKNKWNVTSNIYDPTSKLVEDKCSALFVHCSLFLVAKATLEIAGHGKSVCKPLTLFDIIIMTSYQYTLNAYVNISKCYAWKRMLPLRNQYFATTGYSGLVNLAALFKV